MLSYQHSYHAGNFADVHKHVILSLLLQSLNKKSKPWSYFETHAGAARYDLTAEQALKTGEYKQGIARVYQQPLPGMFAPYIKLIQALNTALPTLKIYPGSPLIASDAAREQDQISLMELHPGEHLLLKNVFKHQQNVAVHNRDGFEGVGSLMPPKPNRGLVLVDPSYEVKTEYLQVVKFIEKSYRRWSNGSYVIWYPLLKAGNHHEMLNKLKKSGIRKILKAELLVKSAADERMYGSGMLIINPPWQLDQQLQIVHELLYKYLAEQTAELPEVEWLVPE